MKFNWKFEIEKQVERYQHCANCIYNNFYQDKRLYILPSLPEKFRDRVIFFPIIESYHSNFQKYSKQPSSEYNLPVNIINSIVSKASYLSNRYLISHNRQRANFVKLKDQFREVLCRYFPKLIDLNVNICPSIFGSIGQFTYNRDNISLYPRFDRKPKEIAKLTVTALTRYKVMNGKVKEDFTIDHKWQESQKESSRIFVNKDFMNLFEDPKGFTNIIEDNFSGILAIKSHKYTNKLGFPIKSILTNINHITNLTKSEKIVLENFINNKNKVVTYDRIADLIWKDKSFEKFSLYAISKLIERIRKKIKATGIKTNLIHTQRKEGFVLYD